MRNIKHYFPLLHHRQIVYLDNAATTQKPQAVIDAISHFYAYDNAPVGRGVYPLAEAATTQVAAVRAQAAAFFGAQPEEIIFTSGATESLNIVAHAWAAQHLQPGDEIVLTEFEHHSNLVPWQVIAQQTGAVLKFIPVTADGDLDYDSIALVITEKTKLVAITHCSNAFGTTIKLEPIIAAARAVGAKVCVDASQSAPHRKLNLKELNIDFLALSSHKMLGPTGLGILYIKQSIQHELVPYRYGGGMVYESDYQETSFLPAPRCFEAGSLPIAEIIGFGAALTFLREQVDFEQLREHEAALTARAIEGLSSLPGVHLFGQLEQLKQEGHMITFTIDGMHAHDVAAWLGDRGICVRAGHFCAQPLAKKFGIPAAVRASFYLYNTLEDVDQLISVVGQLVAVQVDQRGVQK